MSVRKEVSIIIDNDSVIKLITGCFGNDIVELQTWVYERYCAAQLDPNQLKSLIESLEDIYYNMGKTEIPFVVEDKIEPDYRKEIEELKRHLSNADRMYLEESNKNCELRRELNEKEAYIGSLSANLKAETENVTVLRKTIQDLRSNIPSDPAQVSSLKEMNEVLIAENDVLRKKVMKLKGFKKTRKKHKKAIEQLKEMEMLAKQAEVNLLEVQEVLKSTKLERDGLEATCSVYQNELNQLKNSGRVYIGGETIHSYGLALVAEERLSHFKKGIKIEKDVLNNPGAELAQAALYCLVEGNESNDHIYPSKWNDKFKNKIRRSSQEDRLKFAAALLIAQIDKDEYVTRNNAEFERKKSGQ
jgi:chromosome segregation ATPase